MKQYKPDTFQKIIEEPSRVKAEAHFVLNDIALKLIEEKELSENELSLLKNLFIAMQETDTRNIINGVIEYRDLGRITTHEMYLIGNYFMTSGQIGPNSSTLQEEFFNRQITPEEFLKMLQEISAPQYTKTVIGEAYKKVLS